MKKWLFIALLAIVALWLSYAAILLNAWTPSWLPQSFASLSRPTSMSSFGDSFSAIASLISAVALILGISAVIIQAKQNKDSNTISALTARQQFLLAEAERLEQNIRELKGSAKFEKQLFDNMAKKKSDNLRQAKALDETIEKIINKI